MEEDYAQGHVAIAAICENRSNGFVSGGLLWKNLLETVKLRRGWMDRDLVGPFVVFSFVILFVYLFSEIGSHVVQTGFELTM